MNRREVAALGCKLIALWAFMRAVLTGSGLLAVFIQGLSAVSDDSFAARSGFYAAVWTAVPTLAYVVAGMILWFSDDRIAVRMTSDDPAPVSRTDFTTRGVLSVALVVMGIYIAVGGLRGVFSSVVVLVSQGDMFGLARIMHEAA